MKGSGKALFYCLSAHFPQLGTLLPLGLPGLFAVYRDLAWIMIWSVFKKFNQTGTNKQGSNSGVAELKIIQIETCDDDCKLVLTSVAQPVDLPLSPEDSLTLSSMEELLYRLGGVGLAAPQVRIPRRMAVVHVSKEVAAARGAEPVAMYAVINPEYEGVGEEREAGIESCYSVCSFHGAVPRFASIRVRYQTPDSQMVDRQVDGFHARVLQHEIDHLDGVLILDHLKAGSGDRRPNPLNPTPQELLAPL